MLTMVVVLLAWMKDVAVRTHAVAEDELGAPIGAQSHHRDRRNHRRRERPAMVGSGPLSEHERGARREGAKT